MGKYRYSENLTWSQEALTKQRLGKRPMPMERRSCKAWVFIEDYDDVGFDDYDDIDDVCDVDAKQSLSWLNEV